MIPLLFGVIGTSTSVTSGDDLSSALAQQKALEARIAACVAAGIAHGRLIVDPGIGFGKRGADNLAILRVLTLFHGLGCLLLAGSEIVRLASQ